MSGRQSGFYWRSDTLTSNLRLFPARAKLAIKAAIEVGATRGERYLRNDAPWTDQTSNARNGLHTVPVHRDKSSSIYLAHSVPYGIYLEVRYSGRYQVILPTARKTGIEVMGLLSKLFAGISAS